MTLTDQGLVALSGFLISVLLGRWLSPQQFGVYGLAFSIFLFLSGFHNALVLEPMSVLGPALHRNRLPVYLGGLMGLHFGLTLLLSSLVGLGVVIFRSSLHAANLTSAFWGLGIGIPWILLFWLWRRASYLEFKPWLAVRSAALYSVLVLLLLCVFARMKWLSPLSAFLLQAVAAIAASALLMFSIRPQFGDPRPGISARPILKEHWKYGRWVVATAGVYWLSGGAYYVLAGMLLRMEDVAALSALQTVLAPASQFLTATTLIVLPWAAARFADGGGAAMQATMRKITILFTAGATGYLLFLAIFGKYMMGAFYAGKYSPYAHLLPLAALPMLLTAVAQGPAIALRAMQAPSEIFVGYSVAGALTVLIGWALTRNWGLAGALVGLSISGLTFLATITLRYRKKVKGHLDLPAAAGTSSNGKGARVAWLMPSLERGSYWQPVFREFTHLFPKTVIFTGFWPGTLAGYEGTFTVRHLRGVRFITLRQAEMAYDGVFAWVPLSAFYELARFRPHIIFTSGFSLFTLYALLLKLPLRCRVIVLWEGISPSIAYLDSPLRLGMRRLMARFFDACVSNTQEGLDYLRRTLDVPERKLECHPYEVPEISALGSNHAGADKSDCLDRPVFLFVGRLIEPKGLRNLLHACSLLKKRGKTRYSVVIVGEGAGGGRFANSQTRWDLRTKCNGWATWIIRTWARIIERATHSSFRLWKTLGGLWCLRPWHSGSRSYARSTRGPRS